MFNSGNVERRILLDVGSLDTILEKLENAHIRRCIYSWTINGCVALLLDNWKDYTVACCDAFYRATEIF